jgi:FkbM family methyltransferase
MRSRRLLCLLLLGGLALPGCSNEPDYDDLLRNGRARYSQRKEELVLRHFFRDRRDGFFVDVGCYRWRELSTTYYLEEHLGWSGIAIDALPDFRAGWEQNRPRSRFFQYVVSDQSGGEAVFYEAEGSEGVSSTSRAWIEGFFEAFFPKRKPDIRELRVPTITLDDLLSREGVRHIDLLSMDIEGSEPPALAGFDIERFRPELVLIEMTPSNEAPIASYFETHGYERIEAYREHDQLNGYFRPRSGAAAASRGDAR